MLDELMMNTTQMQYHTFASTIENESYGLDKMISAMNDEYDTFYDAVHEEDMETIEEELEWTVNSAGCAGYIFTDMGGELVSTSFDNLDMECLAEEVMNTIRDGKENGFSKVVRGQIVNFASIVVNDNEGEALGVVFLIEFEMVNHESIMRLKDLTGANYFIFEGQECKVNTQELNDKDIVLDSAIVKSAFERNEKWIGSTEMFDDRDYVAAFPLISSSKECFGLVLLRADTSIVNVILRSLAVGLPIAFVVICIMVLGILGLITREVVKPVRQLMGDLVFFSKGDLTHEITAKRTCEEMTQLIESTDQMKERIRSVLNPIVDTTKLVENSAAILTRASDTLSDSANRQAASLEEISSSMEEMGANIQQNTDNSIRTNNVAQNIGKLSGVMMETATSSYEAIKQIASNIKAINSLASQTNILALNASVEAARAGEQGRGFSVVAREVRRLSDETHTTAESINMVAQSSVEQAEEAYNNVSAMTPMLEEVVGLVKEITTGSIEQNAGAGQINMAIADLNRVTQENAASAEEIASSSQDLQMTIQKLSQTIKIFKV